MAATQQGRFSDACTFFSNALQIVPDAVSVRANRAQCYAELGKHPEAIREYSKILKVKLYHLKPFCSVSFSQVEAYAEVYLQRARSRQALGQLDGAISDINKAISLDQSSAGLLFARALIHDKQGNIEEAMRDCNAALDLDPYDIPSKQLQRSLETRKTSMLNPPSKKRRTRKGDDTSADTNPCV